MNEAIQTFLSEWREQAAFSGAAYAIGRSCGTVHQGIVGTLMWEGESVQTDSLWDLASVTKPIIALVLMKLLEGGELLLDDPLGRFLPDFRGTDKADVTLGQLLTHTSGIPGQQPLYMTASDPEAMMAAVKALPLRAVPGTQVEYSSQGFMLVGAVAEAVTGERLDEALQKLVLDPLGMTNTMFNPPPELQPRIAATEYCPWRSRLVRGQVHDENAVVLGGIAGHAGLFGSAADLAGLCQALLREGETEQGRWLSPPTVRLMGRNHTASLKLARGLGWQGKDRSGSPAGDLVSDAAYGHTGFTGTSLFVDPENDWFAVLLTNRVHPSRSNDAMRRIRPLFHNMAFALMA